MSITKKILALMLSVMLFGGALSACVYDTPEQQESDAASDAITDETDETDEKADEESFSPSTGIDNDGKWTGINTADYVTLPEITGVQIPAEYHTASEESIQAQIDQYVSSLSTTTRVVDRAVEDGDTVNIDYVGSVDGVEFDGGNTQGNGATVTIGVTNYIPGFLDQLIGHTPGETYDIDVTFPDPYETNAELSGKAAVFKITINYIEEPVEVELTDQVVSENLSEQYGWTTVEQMRNGIKESLETQSIISYIRTYLVENGTYAETMPTSLVEYQQQSMVQYYTSMASAYGLDYATMLTYQNYASEEDMFSKNAESINTYIKQTLALQAVAEAQGLEATDEAVRAYFLENSGSEDYSSFVTNYGEPYVRWVVLQELALEYIVENAVRA